MISPHGPSSACHRSARGSLLLAVRIRPRIGKTGYLKHHTSHPASSHAFCRVAASITSPSLNNLTDRVIDVLLILRKTAVRWWRIHTGTRTVVIALRVKRGATIRRRDKEMAMWHTVADRRRRWRHRRRQPLPTYHRRRGHPSKGEEGHSSSHVTRHCSNLLWKFHVSSSSRWP